MIHRRECEARDFTRTHSIGTPTVVTRCLGCGAVALEVVDDTHQHTQHAHHTNTREVTP